MTSGLFFYFLRHSASQFPSMSVYLLSYPTNWSGGIQCGVPYFAPLDQPPFSFSAACFPWLQRAGNQPKPGQVQQPSANWSQVIAPFLNKPVTSPRIDWLMRDCLMKISCLDASNGFNVLQGLLVAGDYEVNFPPLIES